MPASGAISPGGGRQLDYSSSTRKARGTLAELGLIGKVHLVSTWSNARVIDEIASVFSSSFGLDENEQLKFKYLSVVPGAKVLNLPDVSDLRFGGFFPGVCPVGESCTLLGASAILTYNKIKVLYFGAQNELDILTSNDLNDGCQQNCRHQSGYV